MRNIVSTHLCVNQHLSTVWLERIRNAGFGAVEIFGARQHLDYRSQPQVAELGYWFKDHPVALWSLHAPLFNDKVWGRSGPQSIVNIAEVNKAKRIQAVDEIKRVLDVADQIPFRYLIQHLGVRGEEFSQQRIDAAFTSLEELKVYAGQRGVEILLENSGNELSTAERLNYFIGITHLNLNFCFDVGHAYLAGGIAQEFSIMQNRIRSTHIHDNDGTQDLHLVPGTAPGSIDWASTMKLLSSKADAVPLVFDAKEESEGGNLIESTREAMGRLEQLL